MLKVIQQQILLTLLKSETPLTVRKLMAKANIKFNIKNHIEALETMGLIKVEEERSFPRRKFIFLTERGRRVAELLLEIEMILKSS